MNGPWEAYQKQSTPQSVGPWLTYKNRSISSVTSDSLGRLTDEPITRLANLPSRNVPSITDVTKGGKPVHLQSAGTTVEYLHDLMGGLQEAMTTSPASFMPDAQGQLAGFTKGILSQVNLENAAMIGGLGEVLKAAQAGGKLATAAKATLYALFARQGAEGLGQSTGELAGGGLTPEQKGEAKANIFLSSLMAVAPPAETAGALLKSAITRTKEVAPATAAALEQTPTKGEQSYASGESSTKSVSELEVRPLMGKETPLRQQGPPAGTREGGAETSPAPRETPPGQVGLENTAPAIKVGGKVFTGQPGENHMDIYNRVKPETQPDMSGMVEGFMDNGVFKTREQFKADHPEVPTTVEVGKPHSRDLEKAKPIVTVARQIGSQIYVNFDMSGKVPSPAELKEQFGKLGYNADVTEFAPDIGSTASGVIKYKINIMDQSGADSTKAATDAFKAAFGGTEPIYRKSATEKKIPAKQRFSKSIQKYGEQPIPQQPETAVTQKPIEKKAVTPETQPPTEQPLSAEAVSKKGTATPEPSISETKPQKQGGQAQPNRVELAGKTFEKHPNGDWKQLGARGKVTNRQRISVLEDLLAKKQQSNLGPSMGAMTPASETPSPELKQLTDSLRNLAQSPEPRQSEAYQVGKSAAPASDTAGSAFSGLKAAGQYLFDKLSVPKSTVWNDGKAAIGTRRLSLFQSAQNLSDWARTMKKAVPSVKDREAINNWIDAGGDVDVLKQAASESPSAYKAGYERAQNLTPDQKHIAQLAQNYFDAMLRKGIDNGLFAEGVENYIHRIYETDSQWKRNIIAQLRSGVFTGKPDLAKQRIFKYDFEAEKLGKKPIKDFVQRISAYDSAFNKALADRQIVKDWMDWKMPDGNPAIAISGIGSPVEGANGPALLVRPHFIPDEFKGLYRPYDHPALRKWKWAGKGADGGQVFLQGDALIHPDALKTIHAVLGRSAIKANPIGRTALAIGSTVKQTMLDLSGFHPVQVTVHAMEHRTFRLVDKINPEDPTQASLISHGLMPGDPMNWQQFSEGTAGSSLSRHLPFGIGKKIQAYNYWLFNDYIPRLKMSMALHALERNQARYKDVMTQDQILYRTATEANNAFGELNYEMMGRNKTLQDMLRIVFLAPDFGEARLKFPAQALQSGGKGNLIKGNEQRQALLLGAATLYVGARIINKLLDGQYHFEPKNAFSIVYKNHAYTLRTVQEDLLRAATEGGKFVYSRLNPVFGRTMLEGVTGRDYFGRSRNAWQQISDAAQQLIPISLRGLVGGKQQSLMESFLNAFGVTNRRDMAVDDIYSMAQKFVKEKGLTHDPGEFIYDPDKDPYRNLKLALLYQTPKDAADEILRLRESKIVTPERLRMFLKTYATRPFTGSKHGDVLFVRSLSADQKKTYQKAIQERHELRRKIAQATVINRNRAIQENNLLTQ